MATNNATSPKVIGPSDRIELNVGGDIFHSTVATLAANSAYFASQLSGNYKDTAGDGVTKVFLDQDPGSFRKLLAFMREGMIDAAAIDRGVLLLAEYLQMEELLVAIKARTYKNLHPGSIMMDKTVAADKFDKRYGGIRHALTKGYLPGYVKGEPMRKKKLARLEITGDVNFEEFEGRALRECVTIVKLNEKDEEDEIISRDISIVGALNWLHSHGYTEQLDVLKDKSVLSITFAGYLATTTNVDEPSVFTPEFQSNNCGCTKEFAMVGFPTYREGYAVERDPDDSDPSKTRKISSIGYGWLEKNGYFTCETAFGGLLKAFLDGSGNPLNDRDFVINMQHVPHFPEFEAFLGDDLNRYPFKIYSRPRHPIDRMENESDQEMIG